MAGDGRDVGLSVLELTATWRRADKDETAHQLPVAQRQGLRDAAADLETEEVDHAQAQATMKAAAPSPIASMVSGVSPVDAATPTLSNRTTGRPPARPSVIIGSQLSIPPRKCCRKTSGVPAFSPNLR
jgi:hypothetical protein